MDKIKPFFPFAFNFKAKDVTGLIVSIIIHFVVGAVLGIVFGWLLAGIPIIGILFGIIGWAGDLYCTAGIVFAILTFCGVIK
ncbi:MAG: hypothetical protein E7466_07735 [Ruminococcaceae bacterium]|nr:hypothetical protein [Oscillospiraceae bacterium]MBQ3215013.1 hypothetical protein [Oscillospiraceae bacterium]